MHFLVLARDFLYLKITVWWILTFHQATERVFRKMINLLKTIDFCDLLFVKWKGLELEDKQKDQRERNRGKGKRRRIGSGMREREEKRQTKEEMWYEIVSRVWKANSPHCDSIWPPHSVHVCVRICMRVCVVWVEECQSKELTPIWVCLCKCQAAYVCFCVFMPDHLCLLASSYMHV